MHSSVRAGRFVVVQWLKWLTPQTFVSQNSRSETGLKEFSGRNRDPKGKHYRKPSEWLIFFANSHGFLTQMWGPPAPFQLSNGNVNWNYFSSMFMFYLFGGYIILYNIIQYYYIILLSNIIYRYCSDCVMLYNIYIYTDMKYVFISFTWKKHSMRNVFPTLTHLQFSRRLPATTGLVWRAVNAAACAFMVVCAGSQRVT